MSVFDKLRGVFKSDEYYDDQFEDIEDDETSEYIEDHPTRREDFVDDRSKIIHFKVKEFDNFITIADRFLQNNTVVLDIEGTNKETRRRVLDFLSGVVYAVNGKINRIAQNAYIMIHADVDLSGDITPNIED